MIEAPRHHHLQRAQRLQLVHAAHPARNAREQRGTGKRPQGVVHVERCYSTRAQGTGRGRCRHSARRANVHRPLSTSTPSSARWRPPRSPRQAKMGCPSPYSRLSRSHVSLSSSSQRPALHPISALFMLRHAILRHRKPATGINSPNIGAPSAHAVLPLINMATHLLPIILAFPGRMGIVRPAFMHRTKSGGKWLLWSIFRVVFQGLIDFKDQVLYTRVSPTALGFAKSTLETNLTNPIQACLPYPSVISVDIASHQDYVRL